jgi:hypothetical protein
MYQVDAKDIVVPLQDVPQSSVGAPRPFVIADEYVIVLTYDIEDYGRPWKEAPPVISSIGNAEDVAIVRFDGHTHMFGPPNDEAFSGHPLASRGLHPYGAFKIENSSWIRQLEKMNSVHPRHRPERYSKLQHIVFTFHDSTFECVCERFDVRTARGSMRDVTPGIMKLLNRDR